MRTFTKTERASAMRILKETGSLNEAERITGISKKTISSWKIRWGIDWNGDRSAPQLSKQEDKDHEPVYMSKSGSELFDVDEFKGVHSKGWIV